MLAYLSRYTHRVAISNSRLVSLDERGVTFRWKDYRVEGPTRHKTMTLEAGEFMRRFLLHGLPSGFHRIRHYGLLANAGRKSNIAQARQLLQPTTDAPPCAQAAAPESAPLRPTFVCRHCGAAMTIIDTFECVFRLIVTTDFGIVTSHFGHRDRARISAHRDRPFRHRDRPFRRS